jgi:hypothetical protein
LAEQTKSFHKHDLLFTIDYRVIKINAKSISEKRRERAMFKGDRRDVPNQLHDLIVASPGGLRLHAAYRYFKAQQYL